MVFKIQLAKSGSIFPQTKVPSGIQVMAPVTSVLHHPDLGAAPGPDQPPRGSALWDSPGSHIRVERRGAAGRKIVGAFYFWLPLHPEKPWDHLPVGFAVPKVGPERPQFTQGGGDTPPGCPPMSPLSPLFWSHREGVKQPSLGVRAPPLEIQP